jgi:hypothetical protein
MDIEGNMLVVQERFLQAIQLNVDNRCHVLELQRVEQEDFVDAVDKFWGKIILDPRHDGL